MFDSTKNGKSDGMMMLKHKRSASRAEAVDSFGDISNIAKHDKIKIVTI